MGERVEIRTAGHVDAESGAEVAALLAAAAREDGRQAVSEQGRLHLKAADGGGEGVRHLLARDGFGALAGYAQIDAEGTAELVVAPAARGKGAGRALAEAVREAGAQRVWAHGGHPAARHLAEALGLRLVRELRQLRRPLTPESVPAEPPAPPAGVRVRTFVPGRDEEAWLALNAAAFAHHPEQGGWTARDLRERLAEPWFDAAGFFLAERESDGSLAGFHWTKVHPAEEAGGEPVGEVYVVGVDPGFQGGGLGRILTETGLRHLALDRGLGTVMLYVDADNTAAVRMYEKLGFTLHEVDLMYARD